MESHFRNWLKIAAIISVLLLATGTAATAQENQAPPDRVRDLRVDVHTEPTAAVVEAVSTESFPGRVPATVAGRRKCYLEPSTNIGYGSSQLWASHPNEMLYLIVCDGQSMGFTWKPIDPNRPSGRPIPPEEVAAHLREEIPVPQVGVRANPDTGLVGTESWFWIEGYSGQPIVDSTDAFGRQVEVEARATRYDWSFGDGVIFSSSSGGAAYPSRSEIRHTYERSSAETRIGYPVKVNFVFAVRYRVAGGSWIDLPGISRTAGFRYPVQETQAVISR
jgi:hypothetical protein